MRHALEVRHESFACEAFVDLAGKHGAAIVTACESQHPQIADATADFAYFRVMGAQESQALGYAPDALKQWASRANDLAAGRVVEDLNHIAAPKAGAPRDVFLFFISGFKQRNPAAAMDLIKRLA